MPPVAQHLAAELVAARQASRCPSIAAAVFVDGIEVFSGAVGVATGRVGGPVASASTGYRIGSITKTITAITVLQQVRDGHLELDAPVGDLLPELALGNPDVAAVTARALLMHGSGLLAEPSGPWWERSPGRTWEQLIPQLLRNPDLIGRFHYSNTGYAILGELVARCTGRTWWDVARDDVLLPLGMTSTTYAAPTDCAPGLAVHPDADLLHTEPAYDTLAMAAAGQLWSTVGDLARLGGFLARGDGRVLPNGLLSRMLTPRLVDDVPGRTWTRAYGFGIDVTDRSGTRYVGHGGSMPGFVACLRVRAEDGAVVAVLANSTAGHDGELAYRLLAAADVEHVPDGVIRAVDTTSGDLAGRWFWGPRPYLARPGRDGALELAPEGAGRGSRFVPSGPDLWTGQDEYFAGETLRVLRRGERSSYLDLGSFRFTRSPYDPSCDIPGGVDPAGWH